MIGTHVIYDTFASPTIGNYVFYNIFYREPRVLKCETVDIFLKIAPVSGNTPEDRRQPLKPPPLSR